MGLNRYISVDEYLMGRAKLQDLPDDLVRNVNIIVPKANELLSKFGQYRPCNSGYRSVADQQRINPKSMKSKHLTCQAIDIADKDGKLKAWILKNVSVLEELGLYCEDFAHTPTWVHIQCVGPKSGKRFFIP
jgi:uncharacterized protein YcbK (DUF882 family)